MRTKRRKRLTKAFDEIFYSLAERRIVLLPRENEGDKLPGIYEFPRELRKLRTLLVQFLVDLARPSHLGTNPFLRGFYFTGVRPVVVDDVVAAPRFRWTSRKLSLAAERRKSSAVWVRKCSRRPWRCAAEARAECRSGFS